MRKSCIITTIAMVMILIMVLYIMIPIKTVTTVKREPFQNPFLCPLPDDDFEKKKLIRKGQCYLNGAMTCKDIAEFMRLSPSVEGMTDEQYQTAMSVLSANIYQNAISNDNEKYNVNECIITKKDADDLKITNCEVGGIQLHKDNKEDVTISWLQEEGCVVTEKHLRNNFESILKGIYEKLRDAPESTKNIFKGRIKDNEDATAAHWSRYNVNVTATKQQRDAEADAQKRDEYAKSETVKEVKEEVRAKDNTTVVIPKADHNQVVDTSMKRDCVWDWGEWKPCEGDCGTGKQTRSINIKFHPDNGGYACPTTTSEERSCDTGKKCPIKNSYSVHNGPHITVYGGWGGLPGFPGVPWIAVPYSWNKNGTHTYEYIFEVHEEHVNAEIKMRTDDGGKLYVNQGEVLSTSSWQDTRSATITLYKGQNLIRIVNSNSGGPTGVILGCKTLDGRVLFHTGTHWKCSNT